MAHRCDRPTSTTGLLRRPAYFDDDDDDDRPTSTNGLLRRRGRRRPAYFDDRWRDRVGCVRWGRIRARDPFTAAEMREKARARREHGGCQFWAPRCGASRPQGGRPFSEKAHRNLGRKSAHIPGAKTGPPSGSGGPFCECSAKRDQRAERRTRFRRRHLGRFFAQIPARLF